MKITKRIREEAAQLCSACACNGEPISVTKAAALLYGVPETVAVRAQVTLVALHAWGKASRALNLAAPERATSADELQKDYAEAEALLRTGWTP